jgi:hypothetical protein
MAITSGSASYGIAATGSLTSTNTTGSVTLGKTGTVTLSGANIFYSIKAFVATAGDTFQLNMTTGSTSSSTAYTAGVAQVETATAAGAITGSGNASVVVTAAGMTGSPKTISVAVTNGDSAAVWAGKVRTALNADTDVTALFDVSGSSTSIILTRKSTGSYVLSSTVTITTYPANDATLNISLDNGTCTGITTAATSANTTAGVATDGCYILDGDGKDYEGVTLATAVSLQALLLETSSADEMTCTFFTGGTDVLTLDAGSYALLTNSTALTNALDTALKISPTTGPGVVTVSALGTSA